MTTPRRLMEQVAQGQGQTRGAKHLNPGTGGSGGTGDPYPYLYISLSSTRSIQKDQRRGEKRENTIKDRRDPFQAFQVSQRNKGRKGGGTNFRPSTCRRAFFDTLNKPLLSVITTDNQWTRRITARLLTSKDCDNLVVLQVVSYIRRGHPIGFSHIPFTLSPRPIAGSRSSSRASSRGRGAAGTGVGGCRISIGKKINKIKGVPGGAGTRANRRTLYASEPSPVFFIGYRIFRFRPSSPTIPEVADACR